MDRGPGPDARRGSDSFVPVSWERAIEILSSELRRVYDTHGAASVYGGSYGWASAGRFHHAQGQLHRFLNCLGGYVWGDHTYSNGALTVIMPHVLGSQRDYLDRGTAWSVLERETELFICFGGLPLKNTMVTPGGAARHPNRDHLLAAKSRGAEFVLISPVGDDLPEFTEAQWLPIAPGTDVALMLALAHTLADEELLNRDFLSRCCEGYERFESYLFGREDGQKKTPEWAAPITGIAAETIRALARRMAKKRTFINANWSLQRAEHGEQAPWMTVVLAAMLGQIGLPGGGFGHGYGSLGYVGRPRIRVGLPTLPQGTNPIKSFIPFARIAEMLLHPGEPFDFDGQRPLYPDIRLVYWCGGNPFHHHQDLAKLRRALARLETIVVHEPHWTAMARHADIVLPATMTLERNDIGGSPNDAVLIAMRRAVEPVGLAKSEFDIFSDLARAMGIGERFTENLGEMDWIRRMYGDWKTRFESAGGSALEFDEFWEAGCFEIKDVEPEVVLFEELRANPKAAPLKTPSGKIEIFSETIAGFNYDDCSGHPAWLEPKEWHGAPLAKKFPLTLVANNPTTRLHSQLDVGGYSQASKIQGREPMRMNPADAAARGIRDGDVVRIFNSRGSCLAGVVVSDKVRPGAIQLATGAWYDPLDPADLHSMCVHGNPNVLTMDCGTSRLAQACAGQHALVEVDLWKGPLPPIRAYDPPTT